MQKKYRSIFVSDVHLGSKDCKAEQLIDFLKHNTCDTLYLVGDIIDGWKMQQNKLHWKQSHTNVIHKILEHAKQGTRVVYIAGNHDEFLRPLIHYNFSFGSIQICNQIEHVGADGKRYLVIHGDLFDGITGLAPWVCSLGDQAYNLVLTVNSKVNWARHRMGFEYLPLSKYLKQYVKKAVDFIFQFEKNLSAYCYKRGFDGVICGHIHNPEIKEIDGIVYMNDGDFVENCTALVEHWCGRWEIITWTEEENHGMDSSINDSSKHKRPKRPPSISKI